MYAYGGNPEAAELGGINTRRTVMLTFVLMGVLVAVSAAIQTARLNAAVTNLGVQNELDVIAAAVIGGTSFAGGIGTIPGAVLGAVVMQSLRSGMVLLKIDSPSQDIVVGVVLVTAVAIDAALRSGRRQVADRRPGRRLDRRPPSSSRPAGRDGRAAAMTDARRHHRSHRRSGGTSRSWRCATSASPSAASTPSTASPSTSTPARWSPSSAATGPASRRSCTRWPAPTRPTPARSSSTASR